MISMAVYGAVLASTSGGAMVAIERALGWSRQLRLTPLKPVAYIAIKSMVALALGALSVAAGQHRRPAQRQGRPCRTHVWIACALIAWAGSASCFAAFGLFVGYLLPSENVMQVLGPGWPCLAVLGGLLFPIDAHSDARSASRPLTPDLRRRRARPLAALRRLPCVRRIVNAVVWLAIFVAGAAWRMSKDTARV